MFNRVLTTSCTADELEKAKSAFSKIKDAKEFIYAAVEYDSGTFANRTLCFCFRGKDNMTHRADVMGDTFEITKTVSPMK